MQCAGAGGPSVAFDWEVTGDSHIDCEVSRSSDGEIVAYGPSSSGPISSAAEDDNPPMDTVETYTLICQSELDGDDDEMASENVETSCSSDGGDLDATAECTTEDDIDVRLFWDVSDAEDDYYHCRVLRENDNEVVVSGWPDSIIDRLDSNPPQDDNVSYLLQCRTFMQYIFGSSNFAERGNPTVSTDTDQCVDEDENIPPTAVDDGSAGNPIPIESDDGNKNIPVMDNDYDEDDGPDPLSIVPGSVSTQRSGSSVSISGSLLNYNPGNLDPGDTDEIEYTITDGEDTDSATVHIQISADTGEVTVSTDLEGLSYTPYYADESLGFINGANEDTSEKVFTVDLSEERRDFVINYADVTEQDPDAELRPEDGDDPWIDKFVDHDKTGQQNSAWLSVPGETGGENQPPEADFIFSMESPDNPECADGVDVEFNDRSSDPDGDLLTYDWDFGDGNTSTEKNPTHTYPGYDPIGGSWDVTLTVSDGEDSDSVTHSHNANCNI